MAFNSSIVGAGLILLSGAGVAASVAAAGTSPTSLATFEAQPSLDVEVLAPSGETLAFFKMYTRDAPSEYYKPKCGLYSYNIPDGYGTGTASDRFQFTAAARVAAELKAINENTCNCPYDRDMAIEPVLAVIEIAGTPEQTKNGAVRHRLTAIAERLEENRLKRCAG